MIDGKSVYISKICTKNGQELLFKNDDIVVFVGPNNVGKSQCLRDIYNLSEGPDKAKTIVLSLIEKTNEGVNASNILKEYGIRDQSAFTNDFYYILDKNILDTKLFNNKNGYGTYRELFIANLETDNRLQIVKPPKNIDEKNIYKHPILCAGYIPKCRKWLSDNFRKAFGLDLIPNTICGNNVPLCMGQNPDLSGESFDNEIDRQERLRTILKSYKTVHEQGDGIKSFVGILLYLMLEFYQTYLIDEPESFLHHPQATTMGRIIGESTTGRQCFISTHSEHLIKGLLDAAPNRVKIIRITRTRDINYFSILDNKKIHDVWDNPILKHSNIMSGIFYNDVVLCESDSDCKIYSIINDYQKEEMNKYSETLFIHCGGKHRMPDVVLALKSLGVKLKVIVDIDVLSDGDNFKSIVDSMDGDFNETKKDYEIVYKSLCSKGNPLTRKQTFDEITKLFESSDDKYLSKNELSSIKKLIKPNNSWAVLKENGISSIPPGEATNSAERLFNKMKELGIFIVSCGELESFIKEVGGHGPQWVDEVLKEYPDLNDIVYDKIKNFVLSLNL